MSDEPSVEEAIVNLVVDRIFEPEHPGLGYRHAGAFIPDDLEQRLPYVSARRIGGPRGQLEDYPLLDIDCFDSTIASAEALAERVDGYVNGPSRIRAIEFDGHRFIIDTVFANPAPRRLPWEAAEKRYGATYTMTVRRR